MNYLKILSATLALLIACTPTTARSFVPGPLLTGSIIIITGIPSSLALYMIVKKMHAKTSVR